jgi:hypothetical protein
MKFYKIANEYGGRSPFSKDRLLQSAFDKGFISVHEVMSDQVSNAAEQVVEGFSDWPEGQGFGSSDMNAAIRNMLSYAGIQEPSEEEFEKNREMAKGFREMFSPIR